MKNVEMCLLPLVAKLGGMSKHQQAHFLLGCLFLDGFTSEEFADYLLEKADVVVAAGKGFGEYGEGYIRVGLLMDEDRLEEAVKRIEKLNLFK